MKAHTPNLLKESSNPLTYTESLFWETSNPLTQWLLCRCHADAVPSLLSHKTIATMFRLAALAIVSAGAISAAAALVPTQGSSSTTSRREAFGKVASGLFGIGIVSTVLPEEAQATKALTGQASQFTGFYDDPNHPGCLRSLKVVGPKQRADGTRSRIPIVEVKGYDGKEGEKMCTSRPQREDLWSIEGKLLDKDTVALDFSSKGGPANVKGSWEEGGIVFPDGNKWSKVTYGTPDRLPKDMKTLKSDS